MLRPGQEVGNYRVEGLVGRGGQGIVYRAVHVRLGTPHVLKLLHLEVGPLRDRLLEEGRIQARLKSPHVVPVTDALEVDGALGLVAEYVLGAPLDVWMAAGPRPLEARLALFRDLAAGVAAAHAARIVHRDLKPGNVLVEEREGRPFARVTDFGVAKVLDDARARGSTLPGMAIGTPGYMAPEQLRDAATVDARADVFALGCLLYELVAQARAWPECELAQYAFLLDTSPPPSLSRVEELPPALASRLDAVVAACLARDPRDRPADAAAVLALLDGDRVSTPRTPTAVPAGSWSAGGLGSMPPWGAPTMPSGPPPEALARAGRGRRVAAWSVGLGIAGVVAIGVFWGVRGAGTEVGSRVGAADGSATAAVAIDDVAPKPEPSSEADSPDARADAVVEGARPRGPSPDAERGTVAAPQVRTPAPTGTRGTSAASTPPAKAAASADTRAPRPGRVVIAEGDGELAWLQRGDEKVAPSSVPPGHYRVYARFGAEDVVEAGNVAVQDGATVRLRCDALALRCRSLESP